jgi:predicted dehydrogenase
MVRIGVVGCARILPAHLRGLKAIQEKGFREFRITALCARKLEDARMFRKRGEGPAPRLPVTTLMTDDPLHAPHMYVSDLHKEVLPELYTDWREMLRSADIDAVLNLTPVHLHHTVSLDALGADKHVLVEKPFSITVKAGRAMVDEAEKRGRVVGVAESARYAESTRMSRWAIESGLIGEVQMWIGGGMGALDWSPDVIVAKTPWRHRKLTAGGGPVVDGAVHTFDLIRYLCGEISEIGALAAQLEPVRVIRDEVGAMVQSVDNEVEDAFFANLRFESGAVGTLFGGLAGHGEPTGMRDGPVVYGSKGCLKGGTAILDGGARVDLADHFHREAPPDLKESWFPRGVTDRFGLELLDFLHAIEGGRAMETSGEEGLRDLACSMAVLESSAAGRAVGLGDVLEGKIDAYQREIDEYYGL